MICTHTLAAFATGHDKACEFRHSGWALTCRMTGCDEHGAHKTGSCDAEGSCNTTQHRRSPLPA
jgi:hypothetical protein